MHSESLLTSMVVPFYLSEEPDVEARMIQQMWRWDFETLEITHNYIQWLFPIAEKSRFNSKAPVLDDSVIQCFRENSLLTQNLQRSLAVMLSFYGLTLNREKTNKTTIEKAAGYPKRKQEWLGPFNHNDLRITRIIKCLMTLGLHPEAQAVYSCLKEIYSEDSEQIGAKTLQYWTSAVVTKS